MTEDRLRGVVRTLQTTMEQCANELRGGRSPHEIADHLSGQVAWAEDELENITASSMKTNAEAQRLDALRAAMQSATESSLHPSVKALASLIVAALGEPTEVRHG